MTIDKRGKLTFCHIRDSTFDVNDFLLELKGQLKSWREVYWRVWGLTNYLSCTRCGDYFQCAEFGHCKYHPEPPRYENDSGVYACIGTYPCCHQKSLRFDPTQQNKVSLYTNCHLTILVLFNARQNKNPIDQIHIKKVEFFPWNIYIRLAQET